MIRIDSIIESDMGNGSGNTLTTDPNLRVEEEKVATGEYQLFGASIWNLRESKRDGDGSVREDG